MNDQIFISSHIHMHLKSTPDGSPNFMAADFFKLDLPKLTADAAKYPSAGVPPERMEFWRNLERSLLQLHEIPDGDDRERWLLLVCGLQTKKFAPAEHHAPPVMSSQIMEACAKDRQPIPEVCKAMYILFRYYNRCCFVIRLQQRAAQKLGSGREHLRKTHQPKNLHQNTLRNSCPNQYRCVQKSLCT